jgi:tRNA(Ile)-lysidine synthase
MLKPFESNLFTLVSHFKNKRFLIAASGGLDSTVLIHLCHSLNLDIGICHVNFQLRGEESDADEKFLVELAKRLNCPIFTQKKDTKTYAKRHQLSTQVAAREIRYKWFEVCLKGHQYDYLLTAHHADDNIETYLINSFRGTGIKGLTGIPKQRDYILRPLLGFSRADILSYAESHNILWREDKSNNSDHYFRNRLRHHLIPFFKSHDTDIFSRFETTQSHISRQENLLNDYISLVKERIFLQQEPTVRIGIKELELFSNPDLILIELLKDYGFVDAKSIANLIYAHNGKFLTSEHYKIVKERGFLELYQTEEQTATETEISLDKLPQQVTFTEGALHFSITDSSHFNFSTPNIAFIDKALLTEHLVLRPLKTGDFFYPLGMTGKRKLSDFLKDEKLTNFEKSKTWVLTHKNDIIWVINLRIDNRYKITKSTKTCLKIEFSTS